MSYKLKREDVLLAMGHCGYGKAPKWDNERLATKLLDVPNVLPPEEPTDEATKNALAAVVEAAKAKESDPSVTIEVYSEGEESTSTDSTSTSGGGEEEKEKAKKAEEKAKKDAEKAAAKEEKERIKAEKQAAAKAAKEAEDANKPKNVRPGLTREYIAAQVIAKHGLKAGVTRELCDEVDAIYGKANFDRSWSSLTRAWHTLNGYLKEYPVSMEPKSSEGEKKNDSEEPSNQVQEEAVTASAE